jgi:hypothetical protein
MTNDPNAPGVVAVDRHKICPYRQKEVLAKLKDRLPGGPIPTSHDLMAINRVYGIAQKEDLSWEPQFSSRQHNDAYVDWIVEKVQESADFAADARRRLHELK